MEELMSSDNHISSDLFPGYQIVRKLGEGTYGCVLLAYRIDTRETVAIKLLKHTLSCNSVQDCLNIREVKALLRFRGHPNIIQLKEFVKQGKDFGMVFEFMDSDLGKLIRRRKSLGGSFSEPQIRHLCFQILNGLHYMHKSCYFHRDLKPDNILLKGAQTLKIGDLGLAREFSCGPSYTDRVGTRWYQAPEVLLFGGYYNSAVDMWALGAIMAELFLLQPIFRGKSTADQVLTICSIMGTPDQHLPLGPQLAEATAVYQLPQLSGIPLSALIPDASESAIDLINSLLCWCPLKRITAEQALQHPFFKSYFVAADQLCSEAPPSCCRIVAGPRPLMV